MSVFDELKQTANGAAVLADWIGDGLHPVPQEQADRRASICLGGDDDKPCPHLTAPRWHETAKGAVAFAIKEQLEAKSKLKLETEMDKSDFMCSACGCCMSLKVWTPIKHVAAHTTEGAVKKYPGFCWQRIEIENL